MGYQSAKGLEWQGIGYGKQWFALPSSGLGSLGDAATDAAKAAALAAAQSALKSAGLAPQPAPIVTPGGMSTGVKVLIGVGVLGVAYLLLRRK